jgi:ANTAR domain
MPGSVRSTNSELHELYARAQAARNQSRLLAERLSVTRCQIQETLQLIQAAWSRAEQIHQLWLATYSEPGQLRYSAYARLQARMATMPVIEQAKGIIMAQHGWPEDQAFDALRRASQRANVKVRDLAAKIVATARAEAAQPRPAPTLIAAYRHPRKAAM